MSTRSYQSSSYPVPNSASSSPSFSSCSSSERYDSQEIHNTRGVTPNRTCFLRVNPSTEVNTPMCPRFYEYTQRARLCSHLHAAVLKGDRSKLQFTTNVNTPHLCVLDPIRVAPTQPPAALALRSRTLPRWRASMPPFRLGRAKRQLRRTPAALAQHPRARARWHTSVPSFRVCLSNPLPPQHQPAPGACPQFFYPAVPRGTIHRNKETKP